MFHHAVWQRRAAETADMSPLRQRLILHTTEPVQPAIQHSTKKAQQFTCGTYPAANSARNCGLSWDPGSESSKSKEYGSSGSSFGDALRGGLRAGNVKLIRRLLCGSQPSGSFRFLRELYVFICTERKLILIFFQGVS